VAAFRRGHGPRLLPRAGAPREHPAREHGDFPASPPLNGTDTDSFAVTATGTALPANTSAFSDEVHCKTQFAPAADGPQAVACGACAAAFSLNRTATTRETPGSSMVTP
jgi:hypothetical protein